jgi:uncharacterized protein YegL
VDAAALAGSLELPFDPDLDEGLVDAKARDMLARTYPEAVMDQVAPGTEVRSVVVEGHVDVRLMLMAVLGLAERRVSARAEAGFNNLEVVFVIDNSGSMKGAPIENTNAAADSLVDLLIPDGGRPAVTLGLVPFRSKVRLPAGVDGLPAGCRNVDGTLDVGLRPEYRLPQYRYPSWYPLKVDEDTCSCIPFTRALTGDKDAIKTAVAAQNCFGPGSGTLISEGLKWARHVLTPEAPFTEGSDEDDMRKIIILLTDGDTEDGTCGGEFAISYRPNNYWTNAWYNAGITTAHCNDGGVLNAAMLAEAQAAKAAGIEIFVIRYGDSDATDRALMKAMASSKAGTEDHYFDAPSAYDIGNVFKLIGRHLGWRLL